MQQLSVCAYVREKACCEIVFSSALGLSILGAFRENMVVGDAVHWNYAVKQMSIFSF